MLRCPKIVFYIREAESTSILLKSECFNSWSLILPYEPRYKLVQHIEKQCRDPEWERLKQEQQSGRQIHFNSLYPKEIMIEHPISPAHP